jgi:hypothetical protein
MKSIKVFKNIVDARFYEGYRIVEVEDRIGPGQVVDLPSMTETTLGLESESDTSEAHNIYVCFVLNSTFGSELVLLPWRKK